MGPRDPEPRVESRRLPPVALARFYEPERSPDDRPRGSRRTAHMQSCEGRIDDGGPGSPPVPRTGRAALASTGAREPLCERLQESRVSPALRLHEGPRGAGFGEAGPFGGASRSPKHRMPSPSRPRNSGSREAVGTPCPRQPVALMCDVHVREPGRYDRERD